MLRVVHFTFVSVHFLLILTLISPNWCLDNSTQAGKSPWILTVNPANKTERLGTGQSRNLHVHLTYDDVAGGSLDLPEIVTVSVRMSNDVTISLSNNSISFTREEIWADDSNRTIQLTGQTLGVVHLDFFLQDSDSLSPSGYPSDQVPGLLLVDDYLVTVVRSNSLLDIVYTYGLMAAVMINTVNMGCGLDLSIVKATLKKPIGPIVGFISQFTFMPLFAFTMAWVFLNDNLLRLGLFIIGVCPGGTGSNFWTLLFNGDVNLSITMTFLSTIGALGMMPFWIWMLGGYFLDGFESIVVPYSKVLQALIFLTLPLGVGLLIQRFFPRIARFLAFTFIKPFTVCIILWQLTLGVINLKHVFILWDWGIALGGMSVAWSGFFFGAIFAWIMRLSRPQIIAISLETALQNGNLGYIILKMSLPEPYSDLAALPPMTQILMTAFTLHSMLATYTIYKCTCRRTPKNSEIIDDKPTNPSGAKPMELKIQTTRQDSQSTRPLLLSSNSTCTTPSEVGSPDVIDFPPEPVFHGGPLTPEFRWAQRPSLFVPNSPTLDPRL